ncbi:hypothetical protein BUALT_Bualt13G0078000 [Buddleja alternifolia]|uniref:Potassium transporter n=1 Tax=Buddleja alternifolia TaxID=168488 RepID=A0AAV6WR28_9LAMI|nr:hypothetical protein BUALT_Bualt13G0078000 [Buddleja alternifolia]
MSSISEEPSEDEKPQEQFNGKKLFSTKLRRYDSLDIESGRLDCRYNRGGAVAKELCTGISEHHRCMCASTFTEGIKDKDDILGVLSLIFYTITLIPLIKYVFIVLRANDHGDGGTFALYSLICRYAKVGLIPSQEIEDENVSTFKLELPNNQLRRVSNVQSKLENSNFAKYFLLFATMLGTSMVIGDGVLTPCISVLNFWTVLSAVGGLKESASFVTEDMIVWISVAILVFLFMVQRFGTDKIGYCFAPILCVWFCFIAGIGIYNLFKYDPYVVKAINPIYIIDYFKRNKKRAWISLGGTVLSITGTEALFADVGHFSVRSIQISMCIVAYPALILAYLGQASFLRKNELLVASTFYKSIPEPMYWPMFVVAVFAAIIASQAMISGTFSIIQQSLSLGCFPRVKIVHTSAKYPGQVYAPEINYLLMLACVCVTLGFRTTEKIGNAYGIAVVFVMTLTSTFLVLVMIMIWKTHILVIISYILIFGTIEIVYLSAAVYKFDQGGYLPLAFAMILMSIMYIWNIVWRKKYYFELENKIPQKKVKEIIEDTNSLRLPGLAIFYSELVHGIPPIFKHYIENVPAVHSVLVFVSFKSLPISKVPTEERFLLRRVQPKDLQVFRCVVRYGYKDVENEQETFERLLSEKLKEFIRKDYYIGSDMTHISRGEVEKEIESGEDVVQCDEDHVSVEREKAIERDVEYLDKALQAGVVHLVGEHEVVAAKGANICKRVLIDYAYNFLTKNLSQSNKVFDIPYRRMLKVGMTYEL